MNDYQRRCDGVLRWWVLAAVIGLVGGCSPAKQDDPDLVAKVGKREIRVAEYQAWMRRRGVGTNEVQKMALLDEMVGHHAAVERALSLGLDRDPKLRLAYENQLVNALRAHEVEARLSNAIPSLEQARKWYETNRAAYSEPAMRRGAILFRELGSKASEARRAEARKRLEEARAKAVEALEDPVTIRGFGALAVEYSEDPVTRYKGGDLGWLIEGRADSRFSTNVLRTLFSLSETNRLSGVVETPEGYYLVKLLEDRPGKTKPFESVKEAVLHRLQIDQRQAIESSWSAGLREGVVVLVNTNVLARVEAPRRRAETEVEPPALR